MTKHNLFSEFPSTTKADWLNKIERDLKGRPISELTWDIPNMSIAPFAHADEMAESYSPISEKIDNTWQICENILVDDFKKGNQQALNALMGGANALHFLLSIAPSEADLAVLLNDIELSYIATYFTLPDSAVDSFAQLFQNIAQQKDNDTTLLRGGILNAQSIGSNKLPLFKTGIIDATTFFKGSENVIDELTETVKACDKWLAQREGKTSESVIVKFDIGISYFIEIAKLRAFKLLWGNLLEAYQLEPTEPTLWAHISEASQVENTHTNKIRATTQAMSAVIGGIEILSIAPSDTIEGENSDLNIRIARNIQHLLQMESYLDKVADPSAGSYYIEKLTNQMAETVWAKLQEEH